MKKRRKCIDNGDGTVTCFGHKDVKKKKKWQATVWVCLRPDETLYSVHEHPINCTMDLPSQPRRMIKCRLTEL